MEPINFNGANDVLTCPEGMKDCIPLVIHRGTDPHRDGCPVITSCHAFSPEEYQEVIKSGKVFIIAWGNTSPPVLLSAFNPIGMGWAVDSKPLQPEHPSLSEYGGKHIWDTLPIIKQDVSKEVVQFFEHSLSAIALDDMEGDKMRTTYIVNGYRYLFNIV